MSLFDTMSSSPPLKSSIARDFCGTIDFSDQGHLSDPFPGIAKRMLKVDELPQGAYAQYEKGVEESAFIYLQSGSQEITEGDKIMVPTFEICIEGTGAEADSLYTSSLYMNSEEDRIFCSVLDYMSGSKHCPEITENSLSSYSLDQGLAPFPHAGGLSSLVVNAVTSPSFWEKLKRELGEEGGVKSSFFGVSPLFPYYFNPRIVSSVGTLTSVDRSAEVYLSKYIPDNSIFFMAVAEMVGVMPVRQSLTTLSGSGTVNSVVYEEIGLAIINPGLVRKVSVQ
jgi:hypothetical protein